jgi:hypothetical protein
MEKMKEILFVTENKLVEEVIPMPKPAKFYLPDWYKNTTKFFNGNKLEFDESFNPLLTVKACMPLFDILSMGYIQETWCDIHISRINGALSYSYKYPEVEIMGDRDIRGLGKFNIPEGYDNVFFHWNRVWNPILPKGYSAIITHPFYSDDLPFKSFSAVVDYDNYNLSGKVGFVIKEGFEGVIPAGTPMYQIIPFKRDNWISKKHVLTEKEKIKLKTQRFNVSKLFSNAYKKIYWNRKEFN